MALSLYFYAENEDIKKNESINTFEDLFKEYKDKTPKLQNALKEMFL